MKDVFLQRVIFGTLLFLVCIIAFGIVSLKRIKSQAQNAVAETATQVQSLIGNPPKPPPPGETVSESGHLHGDEWHADPHKPVGHWEVSDSGEIAPSQFFQSPVEWSNPLMPDEIPEHLKMPPEWENRDYTALSEEKEPQRYTEFEQRLRTLTEAVIENYNPERPIAELWDDFIRAEKLYHAHSEHAQKYTLPALGGFRGDWYYQEIWNFPEIYELILSEEPSTQWMNVYHIEMGKLDPNFNRLYLHDGREFRTQDEYIYDFVAGYDEEQGTYQHNYRSIASGNIQNVEPMTVNLDTISDAELKRIQGWNYNVNPYTGKPTSR